MKAVKQAALMALLFTMSACGSGISGSYQDEMGVTEYEFRSNGTVLMHVMGTTVSANYTVDGDEIFLGGPQGGLVFKRNGDTLEGPMGMKLTRIN